MNAKQAEAIAIIKGVRSREIAQIKRQCEPVPADYTDNSLYVQALNAAEPVIVKALLERAGADESADAQAMLSAAYAALDADDENGALRLAVASNLLN